MYFDWFEVDYARRFEAQSGQLTFNANQVGPREYRVGQLLTEHGRCIGYFQSAGATAHIITGHHVQRGPVYGRVRSNPYFTGDLFCDRTGSNPVTESDQLVRATGLSGGVGADYLIITHRDFITASQMLADYRASQGLRTRVINVDDLYNEYNDGIYHPIAIKNFLRDAYVNWPKPAPTYVLLVGDGHWNFKGYTPV